MSINSWLISLAIFAVVSGGMAWHIYNKGFSSGKEYCQEEQKKYEKGVKKNDASIDKKTPFNADRIVQLEWLRGRTVRQ